jgi:hypothetical protein
MKYIKLFEEYKSNDDTWKQFQYEDSVMNHHHGQTDCRVKMYDNKVFVAQADYSIFQNKVYFQFIESKVKGKGYGVFLMEYLADKYGYENLERSSLTEDGAKMRAKLDKKFNFDYKEYKESLSKHLSRDFIDEIKKKHPIVGSFLFDMVKYGYERTWELWADYLRENGLNNKYDFNDISEISFWIKDSVTNNNDIEDEPPHYVTELVASLTK